MKERADEQLAVYQEIYKNLPLLESQFNLTTESAFRYCAARTHFVIVVPYTGERRILAEWTFSQNDIQWSLLGGSLRRDTREDFIKAASRIAQTDVPSIELVDIEPIAFMKNTFHHESKTWIHKGIAFVGRIRTEGVDRRISQAERGNLIDLDTPPESMRAPHNSEVFRLAVQYINNKETIEPYHEHEIDTHLKYRNRYRFHNKIVKPSLRVVSSYIFSHSLAELDQKINDLIFERQPQSIVDVACGDNSLCANLTKKGKVRFAVGNDVSWSQIELIDKKPKGYRSALIFTNHDATKLPFADKVFDVAICKNVLHHMPSRRAVQQLIFEAARIAKRAIIIEVKDPIITGGTWAQLVHKYYLDFLKDDAVQFYDTPQFNEVTDFPNTQHFSMPTIRGTYNFAIIDR